MPVAVSVLIPAHNCERWIADAIGSVLAQTGDVAFDIVVVDDGSTDGTLDVVQSLVVDSPHSLRCFSCPHRGIAAARNECLAQARCELIAWLDADDRWAACKTRLQLDCLAAHPEADIVFGRYRNLVDDDALRALPRVRHELELEQHNRRYLPSALMRKRLFDALGGFDETLTVHEDTELVCRWAVNAVPLDHFVAETCYFRRLHGANISLEHDPPDGEYIVKHFIVPQLRRKRQ